ncbi:hypothetical protein [Paenibacillus silagei]|uniref:Uncharacterized protein n=1 Tax=Paenibacillus silagei TaxID=1670801 RepID=A0ABS4P315_9BACL|nr:hypothetical protein [Paenibacillus silagei]MBP2115932.1 hypothetical protein [Paenibacillus silagei]
MHANFDDLGKYRRGRVWVNEFPLIPYPSRGKKTNVFSSNIPSIAPCSITVELIIAARMVSNYAFIGLSYDPSVQDKLEVEVEIGYEKGEIVYEVIAMQPEEVRLGIPEEYTDAILDEIRVLSEESIIEIPSGKIHIHLGAHGSVASSSVSFRKAIQVLIKLLVVKDWTVPILKETIVNVIDSEIS